MPEMGIPDFPSRASVERKIALHKRNYADHEAGKHVSGFVTPCKLCREARPVRQPRKARR